MRINAKQRECWLVILGLSIVPTADAFLPGCSVKVRVRVKLVEPTRVSLKRQHASLRVDERETIESQFFHFDDDEDGWADGDRRYANNMTEKEVQFSFLIEDLLRWIPMMIPVLAFFLYDSTAEIFAGALDKIANRNWVAVDGGDYQAKMIAPAINGVVVPAISILFANLIGTTISTLRQRQLDIRTTINVEAGQIRILQSLIESFSDISARDKCRRYLFQYTSRLIAESQATVDVDTLGFCLDSELNGLLGELNKIAVDGSVPGPILGESYNACSKLYEQRAQRIASLRSLFPPLHFMIVGTLAVSICIAFLLESNQSLLVFLNAIQLRILWTMLTGTFSALAIVCYDLGNPFRGSYQISKSVDQLYTIRLALKATMGGEA
jgi:hypothetical protein